MKIALVSIHHYERYANLTDTSDQTSSFLPVPSLTLMQLAALTQEKFDIIALDNPINIEPCGDFDLIAISTVTPLAKYVYKIADEFRRREIKVVIGGYHASALPHEAKEHADSVVIGEADEIWPQLLKDFENGKLKSFYYQEKPVDLNKLPSPKRDIFNKNNKNLAPIQVSRGCPIGCEFCAITNMGFRNIYRTRPIEQVIEEVESIPQKYLWFCDPSLTIDVNYVKQFFKGVKSFDKKLLKCNGNINVLAKDDELLKLASEAGCLEWLVGFESISQKSLDSIGKTTNKVDKYKQAVKKIHDYGMEVRGEFIFGFDFDASDIFEKTYESIQEIEIDNPTLNILTPYPGTPLFTRLDKEGRILTKDWSKYNLWNVVFKPKNMSPDELQAGTRNLNKKIFSTSNTVKRILNSAKLGFYPFKSTFSKNMRFWYNEYKNK